MKMRPLFFLLTAAMASTAHAAEKLYEMTDESGLVTTAVFKFANLGSSAGQRDEQTMTLPAGWLAVGGGVDTFDDYPADPANKRYITASYPSDDWHSWVIATQDNNFYRQTSSPVQGYVIGMKIAGLSTEQLKSFLIRYDNGPSNLGAKVTDESAHSRASSPLGSGVNTASTTAGASYVLQNYLETDPRELWGQDAYGGYYQGQSWEAKAQSKAHLISAPARITSYLVALQDPIAIPRENGYEADVYRVNTSVSSMLSNNGQYVTSPWGQAPLDPAWAQTGCSVKLDQATWSPYNHGVLLRDLFPTASDNCFAGANMMYHSGKARMTVQTVGIKLEYDKTIVTGTPPISYCAANSADATWESIKQVIVGSTAYPVTGSAVYTDMTSETPARLTLGESVPIALTPLFPRTTVFDENWWVLIDYNQNGIFELDTEHAVNIWSNGTHAAIDDIHVPYEALLGHTRMRVIMSYSILSPTSICNDAGAPSTSAFAYGEVEDYTVKITP